MHYACDNCFCINNTKNMRNTKFDNARDKIIGPAKMKIHKIICFIFSLFFETTREKVKKRR